MRTHSSLRTWCRVLIAVGLIVPARAASAQEQVEYYETDALGSILIVFDASGAVKGRIDFAPFGEQLEPGAIGEKVFARLSYDGEVSLEYAHIRMLSDTTGRFVSPDRIWAGLFSPQNWNRYAYAANNPATLVDPEGEDPFRSGTNGCVDYLNKESPEFRQNCPAYYDLLHSGDTITYLGGTGPMPTDGQGRNGRGGANGPRTPNTPTQPGAPPEWPSPSPPPVPPGPHPPGPPPGPPSNAQWWLNATKAFFTEFMQAQTDAWDTGYYNCLAERNLPFFGTAATAHIAGHVAAETIDRYAPQVAGAYYHFTDSRFTAWGRYSKVLVPRAAESIRQWSGRVTVLGLGVMDYELFKSIGECSEGLH